MRLPSTISLTGVSLDLNEVKYSHPPEHLNGSVTIQFLLGKIRPYPNFDLGLLPSFRQEVEKEEKQKK